MARIKYPTDFLKRIELFKDIKKKHDSDGGSSPLIPFLNQHNINLGTDEAATQEATQKDNLFSQNTRNAEEATEARNNLFRPVFTRLRGSVQYLKGYYKGSEKDLGDWGITVNKNRVAYPAAFLRRAKVFESFQERHDALGAASPLEPYLAEHNIDLAADGADVTEAVKKHNQMEQAKKNAEDLREKRDLLFNPVFAHVRAIGQYLKALYVANEKRLGDWGYTVDDSPRKSRKANITIRPGETRTVKRLLNGRELFNNGPAVLVLRKGSKEGNEGVELQPGEGFTVKRGWSVLTVVNTEHTQTSTISVEKVS